MSKYIVELTGDQRQYLFGLLLVDEHQLEQLMEKEPTPSNKQAMAFTKRMKLTLAKAKIS